MSRRTNPRTALPDRLTHAQLTSASSELIFFSQNLIPRYPNLSHEHSSICSSSVILKLTSVTFPLSTNCMLVSATRCGTAFAYDTLFLSRNGSLSSDSLSMRDEQRRQLAAGPKPYLLWPLS